MNEETEILEEFDNDPNSHIWWVVQPSLSTLNTGDLSTPFYCHIMPVGIDGCYFLENQIK